MKLDETSLTKIMHFVQRNVHHSPIIYKYGRTIHVRNMTITKQNNHWAVMEKDDLITTFSYRSWAIAYAVALAVNNHETAVFLTEAEKRLARLLLDKELYMHHLDSAEKREDYVKSDILEHRLSRTDREIYEIMLGTQQAVLYQQI